MRCKPVFLLALVVSVLAGCATSPTKTDDFGVTVAKAFGEPFAPFYEISMLRSGAIDLLYSSASFHNKNGRWPTNYAELSGFVKQSNGYLILGEYKRIDLTPLPNDGLEVRYIRPGHTNEMKFSIGDVREKK